MKLNQYPKAIAKIATQTLDLKLGIECLEEVLHAEEAKIKTAIAANKNLTNETQRKAAEVEAKADPCSGYSQIKLQMRQERARLGKAEIEMEMLRGEFAIAKLEARDRIAQLEAAA
jgi:hypothetical protein